MTIDEAYEKFIELGKIKTAILTEIVRRRQLLDLPKHGPEFEKFLELENILIEGNSHPPYKLKLMKFDDKEFYVLLTQEESGWPEFCKGTIIGLKDGKFETV